MTGLNQFMVNYGGMIFLLMGIIIFILIIFLVRLSMRIGRLEVSYRNFMKGRDGLNLEKVILQEFKEIDRLVELTQIQKEEIRKLRYKIGMTCHKSAIVKYDAFQDVGGKLSFVIALLDDKNSGFVINAVHSSEGCYTYAKEIINGNSFVALSVEEKQALRQAAGKIGPKKVEEENND